MNRLLIGLVLFPAALTADPVLAGKTVMGCAAEVLSVGSPSAQVPLAALHSLPGACADFSGEWTGGCFGPGSAYPTNWPTLDGYVVLRPLSPDSPVTAKPVASVDLMKDTPETPVTLVITQEGCRRLTLEWNGTRREIAFDGRSRRTQSESFRRTCHSDGHTWRRTYDFLHQRLATPLWKEGGAWFRENDALDGRDANYGATFLRTVNRDFRMWEGRLRLDATVYVKASRFDPPGFDWSPPSVGAEICLFRRQ